MDKVELSCDLTGYTLYATVQSDVWAWSVSNEKGEMIDKGVGETETEARTRAETAVLKHLQDIPEFHWYKSEHNPEKVKLTFDEL
mgnify:CR=1 FL=1